MDKTYGISDTVVPKRMGASGLVIQGVVKLHWLACNPSATGSLCEIADATTNGVAILLDFYSTDRESKSKVFLPPCPFTKGIYLETFTNMTAITLGYST